MATIGEVTKILEKNGHYGIQTLTLKVIKLLVGENMDFEVLIALFTKLTKRKYRAICALMDYSPLNKGGWVRPKHLYQKGVCSYNKTSETWRELEELGLIEVSKEPIKKKGRITAPTRIRLKTDEKTIYLLLLMMRAHQPELFTEFLTDKLTSPPPQWWIDNEDRIKKALKRLKK